MTLYELLVANGIPIDHHATDLYFLATTESRALLKQSGQKAVGFVSPIDGKLWLEVPFAYDPAWR